MHWDSIKLLGQVRPHGAGSGRVGPVRAEWGWGGVGHALGFNSITLRPINYNSETRPWLQG